MFVLVDPVRIVTIPFLFYTSSRPDCTNNRHLVGLACMTWTGVSREPARLNYLLDMTPL